MDMPMWMKISSALIMGFFIVRMIPAARHWLQNGPKGSPREWITAAMLLGAVVLFIAFLVLLVRSS